MDNPANPQSRDSVQKVAKKCLGVRLFIVMQISASHGFWGIRLGVKLPWVGESAAGAAGA
jgi:hypothetical protein